MRMTTSLVLAAATAMAGALPLSAQAPARVMGAPYHDASRAFIDMMIPHHEMALMMSRHALTGARTDTVKALARHMIEEQTKEIAELKAARRELFGVDSARSMPHMMMMQHQGGAGPQRGMMPMMQGNMDRMFLEHMINHHLDGIDMSVLAEDSQAHMRVKRLAKKIREGQERDVVAMRALLRTLPAPPAGRP